MFNIFTTYLLPTSFETDCFIVSVELNGAGGRKGLEFLSNIVVRGTESSHVLISAEQRKGHKTILVHVGTNKCVSA